MVGTEVSWQADGRRGDGKAQRGRHRKPELAQSCCGIAERKAVLLARPQGPHSRDPGPPPWWGKVREFQLNSPCGSLGKSPHLCVLASCSKGVILVRGVVRFRQEA